MPCYAHLLQDHRTHRGAEQNRREAERSAAAVRPAPSEAPGSRRRARPRGAVLTSLQRSCRRLIFSASSEVLALELSTVTRGRRPARAPRSSGPRRPAPRAARPAGPRPRLRSAAAASSLAFRAGSPSRGRSAGSAGDPGGSSASRAGAQLGGGAPAGSIPRRLGPGPPPARLHGGAAARRAGPALPPPPTGNDVTRPLRPSWKRAGAARPFRQPFREGVGRGGAVQRSAAILEWAVRKGRPWRRCFCRALRCAPDRAPGQEPNRCRQRLSGTRGRAVRTLKRSGAVRPRAAGVPGRAGSRRRCGRRFTAGPVVHLR